MHNNEKDFWVSFVCSDLDSFLVPSGNMLALATFAERETIIERQQNGGQNGAGRRSGRIEEITMTFIWSNF